MTALEVFRKAANATFEELCSAMDGLSQHQAWGQAPVLTGEWLNTDGSVQGIVLHVAGCKKAYGSIAFRASQLRWRDIADELEEAEQTWDGAKAYLAEAHEYWMQSWAHLADDALAQEVPHFSGERWPSWKILQTVILHDAYHAGQVALARCVAPPSQTPPPSAAEDVRTFCRDLPDW